MKKIQYLLLCSLMLLLAACEKDTVATNFAPRVTTGDATDIYRKGAVLSGSIQNTGNAPADATDNLVITDTFNPILSNITVTVNGVVLPTTAYTYNETTGVFTTNPGAITVPAATYTQNPVTGEYVITPGVTTVTVTGTV